MFLCQFLFFVEGIDQRRKVKAQWAGNGEVRRREALLGVKRHHSSCRLGICCRPKHLPRHGEPHADPESRMFEESAGIPRLLQWPALKWLQCPLCRPPLGRWQGLLFSRGCGVLPWEVIKNTYLELVEMNNLSDLLCILLWAQDLEARYGSLLVQSKLGPEVFEFRVRISEKEK